MGSSNPKEWQRIASVQEKYAQEQVVSINAKRMKLADKIVMAIVDKIANDIIRPGPKPEERECYVMAQELRDTSKDLSALVADILKVHDTEG